MKTRSLTEGAMLGAITVLLTILGEYLGIPALIVPVPLILLVYRQGFRLGVLTAFAAGLISSLVAGHVFSGLSILIWGFVGVSIGMALREKFSFPKIMLVGILANLVVMGLNFLLYSLVFGGNLFNEMLDMFVEGIERAMELWEGMGITAEALVKYEQMLEIVPFLLKWGLPGLLLIYTVVMSYLNLAVVRLILKRMGDAIPWVAPFVEWRISSFYSIFLLIGLFLTALAQTGSLPPLLQLIGLNMFIIFFHAYLVIGLSIVWHFFNQYEVGKILRVLFVFLLFTLGPLVLVVVFLGVTDGLFDLRKLRIQAE